MREGGLEILVDSLGKDGMFMGGQPRVRLLDDGVYIEFPANVSRKTGAMQFLGLDIFIPVKLEEKEKSDEQGSVQTDEETR